jgi:hypothetical protein
LKDLSVEGLSVRSAKAHTKVQEKQLTMFQTSQLSSR